MIGWRTPDWWWERKATLAAQLLRSAGNAYGARTAARMQRRGVAFQIPVVTVGAFALGGPGKTPVAQAITRLLIAMGARPAIVARGYGGRTSRLRAASFVDPLKHRAHDVGDEALLLVRTAPVFVGGDRIEAAWLARRAVDPTVLILDDGLQSRQIEPDLAIAVVDGEVGTGNDLCVPAGPLRSPLRAQLPHVDAVIIVGPGERGGEIARLAALAGKTVLNAHVVPRAGEAERFRGKRVVAFAGIGRPQKFFAKLERSGADIRCRHPFADHHTYSARDIAALRAEARRNGALLVTTEKDLVRIDPSARDDVEALGVELTFDDPQTLEALLRDRLRRDFKA